MIGTTNQVDWAEQIKVRVSAEFDRVARALASATGKEKDRIDALAVIAILEEKRAAVMEKDDAGYFIHDWQDLGDQVRRLILQDPRYKAIRANQGLAR